MGMFYTLVTEASSASLTEFAEASGFGLNFDLFETNLVNLSIVIALLVYFGRGFLGNSLSERRSAIEAEIQDAEQQSQRAAESLAEEQQKLAQAQAEAQRILAAAETSARAAKEEILAHAIQEIQRLKESASQDTTSSQERALAELRQRVAEMALKEVEAELKARLTDGAAQQQLVDRSIALLGEN